MISRFLSFSLLALFVFTCVSSGADKEKSSSRYQKADFASRDGIGKLYMGREISKVMGHLGAGWLERPKREKEERTDLLVKNLGLRPTDVVADIGAGSGYFSFRMAKLVPEGKVHAVETGTALLVASQSEGHAARMEAA